MHTAQVLVLNPPVCTPRIGLVIPPNLPSKNRPSLSTSAF